MTKKELLNRPIQHIDMKRHNVVPLVESMASLAFSSRDLARAAPPAWDAARVQGYCVWAHAVVSALGAVNEPLERALRHEFAADLRVQGRDLRAVPADEEERRCALERYYRDLAGVRD